MSKFNNLFKQIKDNNKDISLIISSIIIFFTYGILSIWGTVNLYIISFYKYSKNDANLNIGKTILFIGLTTPLIAIFSLYSIKISEKIGLNNHIRFFTFFYSLSLFLSTFMPNFYLFGTFYLFLPGVFGFGLNYMVILNFMWKKFNRNKGKISGILIGSIGN